MLKIGIFCAIVLAICSAAPANTTIGADPSGGWLSYAIYKAPKPTDGTYCIILSRALITD